LHAEITATLCKISKIAATKRHIVVCKDKCTKFDFQTPLRELTALPPSNPLPTFKGPTSNGRRRERKGEKGENGRERKGREGEGAEGLVYSRRLGPRITYRAGSAHCYMSLKSVTSLHCY